ncbi:MAG TPA: RagB/SusD family nutrient uptake outer membrane protein [Gemmatimonadaceae bacterium]|nr:RagB/SusD family nutrient uptake outer membrane protein [Gemmatimonadaceae bacterium]
MKRYTTIALAVGALAFTACKDNPVANPIDAPTVDALSGGLTRTSLQQLTIGALAQDRSQIVGIQFLIEGGILGRDVYRIDASEPRYVTETLGGNPDPGSFAGGGGFAGYYTAIRAENNLLLALTSAPTAIFTAAEISAQRGFIRTMKAMEYWRIIEARDTVGAPIQTDNPAEVTAVRCKETVLAYVAALLDSANADLTSVPATTKLPVTLPSGFTAFGRDYSVVSNLIRFNRAWKGKVDFYRGLDRKAYTPALFPTAVNELTAALGGAAPGAVPAADFGKGVWYVMVPGGSENTPNPISDAKVGLNPMAHDSVQAGDTRASKIVARSTLSGNGISTTWTYTGAVPSTANQALPIPMIRDEELVLLRAQANIEAGNLAAALLDINSVRTNYGLAPYAPFATKQAAIDAVLYEKRYSLLFEGWHRLDDLREYGRLNNTYLRKELTTDPFNAALPLPRAELNARGLTDNPACTP